ncbi:trimeric intracellular cation channel family protein [Enhydrobacter aerosaccus]|nr:trimeric intracellular cation channel family protein [Enhydrobacter aerosaccus]
MTSTVAIETLDLVGTLVFALSGAVVGERRRMDLFGVLVLAFVTAVAGGMIRDVLIGAVPPASIANWHALALSVIAGLFAFFFPSAIDRLRFPVQVFDAAGLGIFAATGTEKALSYGISPIMAAMLGMLTGIGGGIVRDVLSAQIPVVLRSEIYALAALAGAALVAAGHSLGLPETVTLLTGTAVCLFLRMMAIYRGWHLPLGRSSDRPPSD